MLDRLHVRNFKAIADAVLDLTPFHLLIGPNDTGKTSFLEAIAALSRSLDHPIKDTFVGRWTGRQLVNADAADAVVTIAGRMIGKLAGTYRLSCEFPGPDKAVNVRAATWDDGVKTDIAFHTYDTLSGHPTRSNVVNQPGYSTAIELASQLCPCWYLRWSARNLSLPATLQPNRNLRLAGNGFGLPTLLDDLLGASRERFDKVESELCSRFPEVRRLELRQEKAYDSPVDDPEQTLSLQPGNGKQLYFVLMNNAEIPAPQAAEGMLYTLAYLAILQLPQPPRILLVEEPENGIHPGCVNQIVKLLRQISVDHPGTQVIMASHSPYLVDEMKPEEVTWCRRIDGQIVTERLDRNETVNRQMGLFELGEIWSNYLDPISGAAAISE